MRIRFQYSAHKDWEGVAYYVEADGQMGYACGEMTIELTACSFFVDGVHQYGYRRGQYNYPDTALTSKLFDLAIQWIEQDEEARLMAEWRTANTSPST